MQQGKERCDALALVQERAQVEKEIQVWQGGIAVVPCLRRTEDKSIGHST